MTGEVAGEANLERETRLELATLCLGIGAPGRIRTRGPLLRRQPLCPLSYGGALR